MPRLSERKLVLIVRETRLDDLKARFNTVAQARFYVEQLGGDFDDYAREDEVYRKAVSYARQQLDLLGRVQVVQRQYLPNFVFGPEDLAIALGQDGLVANTVKYLEEQPLIGVNPDPGRYDGQLLPFKVGELFSVTKEVLRGARKTKRVTMAQATLNNGQVLYAVNDLFIGPKSHGSARYAISHSGRSEQQSSSGLIVSTGLGSTGWFSSLITGAQRIAEAYSGDPDVSDRSPAKEHGNAGRTASKAFPWDAPHLAFTIREPFPSRTTGTSLVYGLVTTEDPLVLKSHMPERGVIFSDGVENDFLEFNSGSIATITPAARQGQLVI